MIHCYFANNRGIFLLDAKETNYLLVLFRTMDHKYLENLRHIFKEFPSVFSQKNENFLNLHGVNTVAEIIKLSEKIEAVKRFSLSIDKQFYANPSWHQQLVAMTALYDLSTIHNIKIEDLNKIFNYFKRSDRSSTPFPRGAKELIAILILNNSLKGDPYFISKFVERIPKYFTTTKFRIGSDSLKSGPLKFLSKIHFAPISWILAHYRKDIEKIDVEIHRISELNDEYIKAYGPAVKKTQQMCFNVIIEHGLKRIYTFDYVLRLYHHICDGGIKEHKLRILLMIAVILIDRNHIKDLILFTSNHRLFLNKCEKLFPNIYITYCSGDIYRTAYEIAKDIFITERCEMFMKKIDKNYKNILLFNYDVARALYWINERFNIDEQLLKKIYDYIQEHRLGLTCGAKELILSLVVIFNDRGRLDSFLTFIQTNPDYFSTEQHKQRPENEKNWIENLHDVPIWHIVLKNSDKFKEVYESTMKQIEDTKCYLETKYEK